MGGGVVPSAARNLRPHTCLKPLGVSPRTQYYVGQGEERESAAG